MKLEEFEKLLYLIQVGDESARIEVKRSADSIGSSTFETICAFCNEPNMKGGYLVLGLTKNGSNNPPRYIITGVSDPDKIHGELATICRQNFSKIIRPSIHTLIYAGIPIVVAYIAEAEIHEKPVSIKNRPIDRAVYRRSGASDQLCTLDDLDVFYQLRSQKKFDETPLIDACWEDFDLKAIDAYRTYHKEAHPTSKVLAYDDKKLMLSLKAAVVINNEIKPTVGGMILFGTDIARLRLFPIASRIDYIIVQGTEWAPMPKNRYSQCYEFNEALILAIPNLMSQIIRDIPCVFSMQADNVRRKDTPLIPEIVLREAVCNAVMHRDYRAGPSIQIIKYANRIEFINPGYSLKPEDKFDLPGSELRNNLIARVLHDLHFAESRGTGIHAMKGGMKEANLPAPLFESDSAANKFTLTLLTHHFFNEQDLEWLKKFKKFKLNNEDARSLIALREVGAITNADYRNINGVEALVASTGLRKLRDLGLIEQKGRSNTTYYVPTKMLLSENMEDPQQIPSYTTPLEDSILSETGSLPTDLLEDLQFIRKQPSPEKTKEVIKRLCTIKAWKSSELAQLLNRHVNYVRQKYLLPLIAAGELECTFPYKLNHPQQAYWRKSKTQSAWMLPSEDNEVYYHFYKQKAFSSIVNRNIHVPNTPPPKKKQHKKTSPKPLSNT